jgi:cytidylate kinase
MIPDVRVCSVCAWRETCQKKFVTVVDTFCRVHCPDYTKDVRIKDNEIGDKIVEYHLERWRSIGKPKLDFVVAISRQTGAGGSEIARRLAEEFTMDLVGRQLIELVAKSTKMNVKMVELLDEKAVSRIDSMITSFFVARHLSPDVYFRHLTRVVAAIGERGWSIIVGRGAHLILPREKTIRLRFIAPAESRIWFFIKTRQMTHAEAQRYVEKADADRSGFIKKYFKADADDPTNFDLVVNTGDLGIEAAYTVVAQVIRNRIQAEEKAKREDPLHRGQYERRRSGVSDRRRTSKA